MNFPDKLQINIENYPENKDFKIGCHPMCVKGSGLSFLDLPLSQFKRDSKFRKFGESILKEYSLDPKKYTLIYNIEPEWSNYFTLEKINK